MKCPFFTVYNPQPAINLKLCSKFDQHTLAKWLIYGTKHQKGNALRSLKTHANCSSFIILIFDAAPKILSIRQQLIVLSNDKHISLCQLAYTKVRCRVKNNHLKINPSGIKTGISREIKYTSCISMHWFHASRGNPLPWCLLNMVNDSCFRGKMFQ